MALFTEEIHIEVSLDVMFPTEVQFLSVFFDKPHNYKNVRLAEPQSIHTFVFILSVVNEK